MKYLRYCYLPFLVLVSCIHTPLEDIDGNSYQTKQYGETLWMTQNLRVTQSRTGEEIKYYYPNKDATASKEYGLLYDFETACNVCPEGWRLPTNSDWDALFKLEIQNVADHYKDKQHWFGEENSNKSQFSIVPAGYGNNGEHPNNFNSSAILWSNTKEDEHFIFTYILEKGKDSIRVASQHPEYAFSVRCVKNRN